MHAYFGFSDYLPFNRYFWFGCCDKCWFSALLCCKTNKEDILTVAANMVEIPAISIPYGKGENSLPLGIQIMAKKFDEQKIFNFAKFIKESIK